MSGMTVLPGQPTGGAAGTVAAGAVAASTGPAVASCPVPHGANVDPRLWDLTVAAQAGTVVPRLTFLTSAGLIMGQLGAAEHFLERSYQSLEGPTWEARRTSGHGRARSGDAEERARVDALLWTSIASVAGASNEAAGPVATLYNVDLFAQAGHVQLAVVRLALTQVISWWVCYNNVVPQPVQGGGGGVGFGIGVMIPLDFDF